MVARSHVLGGSFADPTCAQQLLHALRRVGFREDQLGIITRAEQVVVGTQRSHGAARKHSRAQSGGISITTIGGQWALETFHGFWPAVGGVIAGGLLAGSLARPTPNMLASSLAPALRGLGFSDDAARHFDRQFHTGHTVVVIEPEDRFEEARAALKNFRADESPSPLAADVHDTDRVRSYPFAETEHAFPNPATGSMTRGG